MRYSHRELRMGRLWAVALAGLLTATVAQGAIVTMPLLDSSGTPSGWQATYNDQQVGLQVVGVAGGELILNIAKTFTLPPSEETGQFPAILINFTQIGTDQATAGTIRIASESILNQTGVSWTDYHWLVMAQNKAWFDVPASVGFALGAQFQAEYWWPMFSGSMMSPMLTAFIGVVPDGETYTCGLVGDLVIRTDLSGAAPVTVTFKQYPTPEPATMAMLGFGLAAMFVRRRRTALMSVAVLVLAMALSGSTVQAAQVTVPLIEYRLDMKTFQILAVDSGWNATYDDEQVSLVVDQVNLSGDYGVIEIAKTFLLPPDPETGGFPPIDIVFTQRLSDAAMVTTIRIADESITNLTGKVWTDYHWEILDAAGAAWFDPEASTTFGLQPLPQFQQQTWYTTSEGADALAVSMGLVAPGAGYFPGTDGSDLVIRTNPLASLEPVSFVFRQYPTDTDIPEPATMALLGFGLAGLFMRRRGQ